MQGFLASFLEKSIETFLNQQEAVQAQISKIVANTPLATVADITRQNLETLAKVQESMLGALLPKRDKGRDESEGKGARARPRLGSGPRGDSLRQFPREHRPLALDSPTIATERAVGSQHVVAWDEPGDRVGSDGPADGPRGGRPTDLLRDVRVVDRSSRARRSSACHTCTWKLLPWTQSRNAWSWLGVAPQINRATRSADRWSSRQLALGQDRWKSAQPATSPVSSANPRNEMPRLELAIRAAPKGLAAMP